MKFTQTGKFQNDYLERATTIKPLEQIDNILLRKLDYLIGFIIREKSEIVADYVKNLTAKFRGLGEENLVEVSSKIIDKVFSKYEHLSRYSELNQTTMNYYFYLLELKEDSEWETKEIEISTKALMKAWTFPTYYLLQALAESIEREEAIKLYKRFITNYYIDNPSPDRDKFVRLEDMLEKRLSGDTTSSVWVMVHTMLEEGKYAFKNKNCPTCVDSMVELPDVELKYFACCYPDYEKFRSVYSDYLILTMEHTLMQGDSYCSRVLHDTRVDYDLRHPPKEFWDNFEPGKEEEAMKFYRFDS